MKVTQPKVRAYNDLKTIEARLEMIETDSRNWEDINQEGVTGFLMFDALENIKEQVNNLLNKFE